MKTTNKILVDDLLERIERSSKTVNDFRETGLNELNWKKNPESWSALQCIEHLNMYGDYYIPEFEKAIASAKAAAADTVFKTGWLGSYFAGLMEEKNGKIVKMKAPKDKRPSSSELSMTVLERFIKQQEKLKTLLLRARSVNMIHATIPISIARWLRIRLGDTFRFYIYHIERHIRQAERSLEGCRQSGSIQAGVALLAVEH